MQDMRRRRNNKVLLLLPGPKPYVFSVCPWLYLSGWPTKHDSILKLYVIYYHPTQDATPTRKYLSNHKTLARD